MKKEAGQGLGLAVNLQEGVCFSKGCAEEPDLLSYFTEVGIQGPERLSSLPKIAGLSIQSTSQSISISWSEMKNLRYRHAGIRNSFKQDPQVIRRCIRAWKHCSKGCVLSRMLGLCLLWDICTFSLFASQRYMVTLREAVSMPSAKGSAPPPNSNPTMISSGAGGPLWVQYEFD